MRINSGEAVMFDHCLFQSNTATGWGGAITDWRHYSLGHLYLCCLFNGNEAGRGGAMCAGSPSLINCTITGNRALIRHGGGLLSTDQGTPELINCVLWDNEPNDVYDEGQGVSTLTFCNIEDGWPGQLIDRRCA